MILPLLIAGVLASWLLGRLGWRRLARSGYVLMVLVFFATGCGLVPRLLLRPWQAPYAVRPAPDWAARNAIVLLTAGVSGAPHQAFEPGTTAFARITETVLLYRQCRGTGARCTVLVSGGDARHVGEPLAGTYARTLRGLGVDPADLLLETRSMTTWGNARFSRPLLARLAPGRICLVTGAVHLRRAVLAFQLFGMRVTPVRADYYRAQWSWLPDARNLQLTDAALHEYLGQVLYRARGWSGRARREIAADTVPLPARP